MAKPIVHAVVSAGLAAAAYATTRRRDVAIAAWAAGVLIDVDHFVDLALVKATNSRAWLVLPLHGWEFGVALLAAGARRPATLAAGVSYLTHLAIDQAMNGLGPYGYSFLWRAAKGFRADRMDLKIVPHHWADKAPWQWFH
ncbi:MAG: hypothetical protein NZ518_05580 [Dehalococcoidia bacterium]|nr:hypothetical protein [Dehalococcoidia bacterium]